MLSVGISSERVGSVHTSVCDTYAQWMHQFLMHMLSLFWRDLFKFGIFMFMLSIRVRNWCLCSWYASVPEAYAQRMHHSWNAHSGYASVPDGYSVTHQFLTLMIISARVISWCVCSAYTSIPYFFAEGIHLQNEHLKNGKTDVHAEHAHKELMQCSGCV